MSICTCNTRTNCQGSDRGSSSDGRTVLLVHLKESYWNYDVAPTQYVIYGPGESAWTWMAGRSKLQGLNREGIRLQNPPPLFVPGKAGLMIQMKPYQGDKINESYSMGPPVGRVLPKDMHMSSRYDEGTLTQSGILDTKSILGIESNYHPQVMSLKCYRYTTEGA